MTDARKAYIAITVLMMCAASLLTAALLGVRGEAQEPSLPPPTLLLVEQWSYREDVNLDHVWLTIKQADRTVKFPVADISLIRESELGVMFHGHGWSHAVHMDWSQIERAMQGVVASRKVLAKYESPD